MNKLYPNKVGSVFHSSLNFQAKVFVRSASTEEHLTLNVLVNGLNLFLRISAFAAARIAAHHGGSIVIVISAMSKPHSSASSHQLRVVDRHWHCDCSSASCVGVRQVVGHHLERMSCQFVVVMKHHIMRWSGSTLEQFY